MKLQGKTIYLAALERADCRKLYEDFEYDFENQTEPLYLGTSVEKSNDWYEDIQKHQHKTNVRLGIFLLDGTVIGDVALQELDVKHRTCSIGIGIAKLENRSHGYGTEAMKLMLHYGFFNLGMERISGNTLELNVSMQKLFKKHGFFLEGRERKAFYLGDKKYDRLQYGLLREQYTKSTRDTRVEVGRLREIKTERLQLRAITLNDVKGIYAYCSQEKVTQYMASTMHKSLEDTVRLVEFILKSYHEAEPTAWTWGMVDLESEKLIGTVGFSTIGKQVGEFGFSMDPSYWGKGLMSEAINAVINVAFKELNFVRLQGRCLVDNIASEKVMKKAGMMFEGIERKSAFFKGKHHDLKMFAIINEQ